MHSNPPSEDLQQFKFVILSLQVTVKCRRIGGAFGGKASRSMPVAVAAAVASAKLRRPVRLVLNRNVDFRQNAGGLALKCNIPFDIMPSELIELLRVFVRYEGSR